MKRILMTSALVLTTVSGAALAGDSQMRSALDSFFVETRFDVDVSTLTEAQVAKLHGVMSSTETESNQIAAIRAILAEENVEYTLDSDTVPEGAGVVVLGDTELPRDQIYVKVINGLKGTRFDGRIDELTEEELVQAMAVITGAETASEKEKGLVGLFN